ncbi:DUF4199 domain-containing protein [Pedobacter alpinus]|uniref:DUF4199 domain-containing protein n=1 Tax=Pedobacter alpinus TaxID=1590643 RepID=A0ABW5TV62_9SPHI
MITDLNKNAINNGVIIAILMIAIQLLTYYAAPQLLGATWYGIVITVVSVIVYIFFVLDLRKKIGGFWSFKIALKGIFIMSLIANLASSVFNFVFYRFVEPGAYEKIKGYVVDGMTSTFESMGMTGDALDKAVESAAESLKAQYMPTPVDFLKNLVIAIMVGFVLSLIFAAIFKKEAPMFAPVEEAD